MRELTIAGRRIADEEPCYVIAEIGANHGGSVEQAKALIRAAADCGVDAVKFQKRENATLYTSDLLNRPYDHVHSYGPTYGTHREALEFGFEQYQECLDAASGSGVTCFATAFDEASADFLMDLPVPAIKIASGSLTDHRLLAHVSSMGVPIILSTGGGTMADIDEAVNTLTVHTEDIAILHCTAAYPCAFEELNLLVITTLRERYKDYVIGFSGHDNGIAMSLVAYSIGARIIERHFTLNRANKGTDNAFSLEPSGMRKLTRDLSRAHVALGDGIKRVYECEKKPIAKMRRTDTPEGWRIAG